MSVPAAGKICPAEGFEAFSDSIHFTEKCDVTVCALHYAFALEAHTVAIES